MSSEKAKEKVRTLRISLKKREICNLNNTQKQVFWKDRKWERERENTQKKKTQTTQNKLTQQQINKNHMKVSTKPADTSD